MKRLLQALPNESDVSLIAVVDSQSDKESMSEDKIETRIDIEEEVTKNNEGMTDQQIELITEEKEPKQLEDIFESGIGIDSNIEIF